MMIARITGATRTLGKAQGYLGLPVRDEQITDGATGNVVNTMTTAWEPTPDELERIKAGAKIHLCLYGSAHPPVMLSVAEVPEVA